MALFDTGIYEIRNSANSRRYIGSAKSLCQRLRMHLNDLRKDKHPNRHLQFAWNKYGEQEFEFKVILYCDKANLLFYEQRALDTYNALYNLAPTAGSQRGWVPSEETKRNISKAKIGKSIKMPPRTREHRENLSRAHTGRKLSEETRRRMSEAHKGKVFGSMPEETRKKIAESKKGQEPWNKGKTGVYSLETLAAIGAASIGRIFSDETKAEMSRTRKGRLAWNKGKTGIFSEETLKKMAAISRGRTHSPETRQKMAESARIAHARRKEQNNA